MSKKGRNGMDSVGSILITLGVASIVLCIGTLLRAKVKVIGNMLIPASVLGGLLGFIIMNIATNYGINLGMDYSLNSEITNHLFTLSFISIALTSTAEGGKKAAKNVLQGSVGMGIVWSLLFALSALAGALIIMLIGEFFDMNVTYGMLIPYAFTQGPGQSAAIGSIYETFGWENAAMVALAFAAIGFLVAFIVGVPAAKLGIKRRHAKHCKEIVPYVSRGYYKKEEQTEKIIRDTTYSGNIETLSIHIAVIGVCYMLALGFAQLFSLIPGFFGTTMSGMMFANGMLAGYLVKWMMKKLKISFLLNRDQQSKITNLTTDYLIVTAFMAVSFRILGEWIIPILVVSAVVSVITFIVCFYFGQRFGGKNDFERTLGLFGTCTGTVPSGISLVRIVDPRLETTTAVELGVMNLVMMVSFPATLSLMAYASGAISLPVILIILAACVIAYAALLKITRTWKKQKTYNYFKGNSTAETE